MTGSAGDGSAFKFTSSGTFRRDIDHRVNELLADKRLVRRAYWLLWAKAFLVLLWVAVSYGVLVFVAGDTVEALATSVSLGLATAGIGFTIMHDANHGAFAPSRRVNRLMALSLDLIGGSSYVWSAKHLAHHTYPNMTDHDPDIESLPFARLDPAQQRRWWHRYQHLYIWILYAFITIRWQFASDFHFLRRGRAGRSRLRRPNGAALATLLGGKCLFVCWAFLIPLLFHSVLPVLALFLVTSCVASLSLALVFQLSHCVVETVFVDPAQDATARSWQAHQVETTVDFAPDNRVLRLYVGGLNFQIEHHLFSRLPHTLYPQIAPIVETAARAHGLAYTCQPTLRAAMRSHTQWLKQMGSTAPSPARA
jgi:linoleoyl-CoA desaturase